MKLVAYYRVSTAKQGASGLGLEAQRAAVLTYVQRVGGDLVEEFTEVESGRRSDRFQLNAALTMCRLYGARLIIAKLDRLTRDLSFLCRLRDEGADFVAVDYPEADRFTINLMVAFAERERELISTRTKAALAAAKARGTKLGSPQNLTASGRAVGAINGNRVKAETADQRASDLAPIVRTLQAEGGSLRSMARSLTDRGIAAPRGGEWTAVQVSRVISRIEAIHVRV